MNVAEERVAPLMSAQEAARLLGCTPRTVARLAKAGELRAVRLGQRGRWRIVRAGVEALVLAEPVAGRAVDELEHVARAPQGRARRRTGRGSDGG